jgi:hypothetical protein
VITFFLKLSIAGVYAAPYIIYGEDNRIDTFESKSPLFKKLAKSTAAQVYNDNIKFRGSNAELRGKSLGEMYHLCEKDFFISHSLLTALAFL